MHRGSTWEAPPFMAGELSLSHMAWASPCLAQERILSSQSNMKTNSDNSYYDVEVVRDLAALYLQNVKPAEEEAWAIAQVTPTSEQSQLETPRALLDVPEHGEFHILLTLFGSVIKPKEKYSWFIHFPIRDIASYAKRKDAFVNFAFYQESHGGTVICRINKNIGGIAADGYLRYDPVYLIPTDYQGYVLPALKFYKAHPGLLDDQNPSTAPHPQKNKATLSDLIGSNNPLLAAAALRAFIANSPSNASALKPYLEHLQGIPLALGCYMLLEHSLQTQDNSDAGLKVLLSVISSATTIDQLNSILTSVNAVALDLAPYPAGQTVTMILTHLKDRQAALNSDKTSGKKSQAN